MRACPSVVLVFAQEIRWKRLIHAGLQALVKRLLVRAQETSKRFGDRTGRWSGPIIQTIQSALMSPPNARWRRKRNAAADAASSLRARASPNASVRPSVPIAKIG